MSDDPRPSDVFGDLDGAGVDGAEGMEAGAIGAEADPSGSSNPLKSALFSTYKPDTSPEQLSHEYNVSKGCGHLLYGCLQAAGSGDMPALGNIIIGLVLESKGWLQDRRSSSSSDDGELTLG